ncbi:hypothetical protein P691DRAFT_777968 [Macrolepiota fuliginosa MF-IS2]|uniref:Uncharacterized protein n=1 Tax=Macrolepiota fuliginosa MF-IS2 TaxID=1400762 RepID=A0A9P5X5H0_9AGAR|nr:hypothetical protein P691DRAFT_777968 [Macrolepiota fuliginosa MF-IS2]
MSLESPFYAYVQDNEDQLHLFTFVCRDAADQWWTWIQVLEAEFNSKHGPTQDKGEIRRISPQFYVLGGSRAWGFHCAHSLLLEKGAKAIIEDKILESSHTQLIIPPSPRIDYLNGKAYYIRSRAQPEFFWNFDWDGNYLKLSNEAGPTTFIIERASTPFDQPPRENEDVLLENVEVTLMAIGPGSRKEVISDFGNFLRGCSYSVGKETPLRFKFRLLTKERGFKLNPKDKTIQFRQDGLGDRWELVD